MFEPSPSNRAESPSVHRPGRRSLLLGGAVAGASLLLPSSLASGAPALVRSGRPAITHGIQSGDVSASKAVVWARADRPARMFVEVSPTETFRRVRRVAGPILDERTDFTGKTLLRGLPAGEDVFYRVVVADLDDDRTSSSAPET